MEHLQGNKNKGTCPLVLPGGSPGTIFNNIELPSFICQSRRSMGQGLCLLHALPRFCESTLASLEEMGCVWKSLLLFLLFPRPEE